MDQEEILKRVGELSEPILAGEGFELVEIQFRRESRGWILRLFVDREGGMSLDDCVRLSHEIGRGLDVEDLIEMPYTLEVSSPGLTRSLKTSRDFLRYRDRLAKITTTQPIGNRRQFKGRLRGLEEDRIRLEMDGETFQIPLDQVAKANLEIEF